MTTTTFRHHGLLGTIVDVSIRAEDDRAKLLDTAILDEILRLQGVFDRFDEQSELRRWQTGSVQVSSELGELLALASAWRDRTDGIFDPAVGPMYEAWNEAANAGRAPSDGLLARLVSANAGRRDLRDPAVAPTVDLNAIAKGWIVDRAIDAAFETVERDAVVDIVVNAGGDLAHRGVASVDVGIENPLRPFDNEPPLAHIAIENAAIATSGGARRFWEIDVVRYPKVLDPRTGRPAQFHASTSVVAPDAATADVLATAAFVLNLADGKALADDLGGMAVCWVSSEGAVEVNDAWETLSRARPSTDP